MLMVCTEAAVPDDDDDEVELVVVAAVAVVDCCPLAMAASALPVRSSRILQ